LFFTRSFLPFLIFVEAIYTFFQHKQFFPNKLRITCPGNRSQNASWPQQYARPVLSHCLADPKSRFD
jgi:hypothetical protein